MHCTVHAEVHGRVHGVGFRYFVYRAACTHAVSGWVRNTARGTVEAVLHGDERSLQCMREELQRGPALSRVERIDWAERGDVVGQGFEILS